MNREDLVDKEIRDLERKLAASQTGKSQLRQELEDDNLLELFTCVDHLLGEDGEFDMGGEGGEEMFDGEEEGEDEEGLEEDEVEVEEEMEEDGVEEDEEMKEIKISKEKIADSQLKTIQQLTKRPPQKSLIIQPFAQQGEIEELLLQRSSDNKGLLEIANKIISIIHKHKLTGGQLGLATISAVQKQVPIVAGSKTKPATTADRITASICVASMFSNKFLQEYLSCLESKHNPQDKQPLLLWISSGLLALSLCSGKFLLDVLSLSDKGVVSLNDELWLVGRTVRSHMPSQFREVAEALISRWSSDQASMKLCKDGLDKLKNNMDIPGKNPFEFSNTLAKMVDKLMKKRRTELPKMIQSLQDIEIGGMSTGNGGTEGKGKGKLKAESEDPLGEDMVLAKLADKLSLVTKMEKKALKVLSKSTDYPDAVKGILSLNAHGSENKEIAGTVLTLYLAENNPNKFYIMVAQKLIGLKPEFEYSFRLAILEELQEEDVKCKRLGTFIASLLLGGQLDHRTLKYLDTSPLPLASGKVTRTILEELCSKLDKDKLREFANKFKGKEDMVLNLKRICRYLMGREETKAEIVEKLTKLSNWLGDGTEIPEGDDEDRDDEDK